MGISVPFLTEGQVLENLVFRYCDITDSQLSDILIQPRFGRLKTLEISHNKDLTDQSIDGLCNALNLHKTIKELDLSQNGISAVGFTKLIKTLSPELRLVNL